MESRRLVLVGSDGFSDLDTLTRTKDTQQTRYNSTRPSHPTILRQSHQLASPYLPATLVVINSLPIHNGMTGQQFERAYRGNAVRADCAQDEHGRPNKAIVGNPCALRNTAWANTAEDIHLPRSHLLAESLLSLFRLRCFLLESLRLCLDFSKLGFQLRRPAPTKVSENTRWGELC